MIQGGFRFASNIKTVEKGSVINITRLSLKSPVNNHPSGFRILNESTMDFTLKGKIFIVYGEKVSVSFFRQESSESIRHCC